CGVCGKLFSDAGGEHEISPEDTVLSVLTESDYILGDVNDDGEVDSADLTRLARHVANIELLTDEDLLKAADVSRDGEVSSNDLTILARYIAKIITEFPEDQAGGE
ncbi:MAG: dockerin type I repeat-containing protein, partial [Firmicutes bacterium]|nr:dockerin type I repeat-containing protein [Bacillota bacterium]